MRQVDPVGLFDKFKDIRKNRDDKRVAGAIAKIKNPKAIRDERNAAIDFMKDYGDASVAVPALLLRFEYSLEHGINDTREKESCLAGIVAYGEEAIPYVRDHLVTTSRIAWPIKLLKALGHESQVIEILKSALDFGDVSFDQAKVDKNYDILCYMIEYKLPGFVDKLAHFLNDPDERVRFATTEAMIEQDEPSVPGYLERFIGDDSPDNTRIRKSVVEAFFKHRWVLANPGRFANAHVVGPIFVGADGRLELRR